MTALHRETLGVIYEHACASYPRECCGFILADGTVHIGKNIQDELHRTNPALHPRNAMNGYTLSVEDVLTLQRSLRSNNPAVVIYHSHPDVGAYFSDEDRNKALFAGIPIYPVNYLVIDVRAGVPHGAKLFIWNTSEFVCSRSYSEKYEEIFD